MVPHEASFGLFRSGATHFWAEFGAFGNQSAGLITNSTGGLSPLMDEGITGRGQFCLRKLKPKL